MTEKHMQFILRFRNILYIVAITGLVCASLTSCERPIPKTDLAFFPPDIVPHPHIPSPKPSDGWA